MKTVLVALATVLLSSPALAASFSGPRIEADIGWDHPQAKVDVSNVTGHGRDDGVVYGGEAGYDLRFGKFVAGVLAGVDGSSAKDCTNTAIFRNCIKTGRDLAVGARVGAVITPRTLFYAKGEYINVRLNDALRSTNSTAATFSHDDHSGYRLGAGVEYQLTSLIYLKGEYRYSAYRHDDLASDVDVGQANLSRHQVVGGIGLRF